MAKDFLGGLIDKATKRVEREVERQVDRGVKKGVDGAVDAATEAATKAVSPASAPEGGASAPAAEEENKRSRRRDRRDRVSEADTAIETNVALAQSFSAPASGVVQVAAAEPAVRVASPVVALKNTLEA
ncbi:MAG: hypothetical protein WC043_02325 [Pseudobdellovibrionaceae bacterium]